MPQEVTEEQWDQFFEVMAAILNMPGDWGERASRVREEARQRDQGSTLEKFTSWFEK